METTSTGKVSCVLGGHAGDRARERQITCNMVRVAKKFGNVQLQFQDPMTGNEDAKIWSLLVLECEYLEDVQAIEWNERSKPPRYQVILRHKDSKAMNIKQWLLSRNFFIKKGNRISYLHGKNNVKVVEGRCDHSGEVKVITVVINKNKYEIEDYPFYFLEFQKMDAESDAFSIPHNMKELLVGSEGRTVKLMQRVSGSKIVYGSGHDDYAIIFGTEKQRSTAWQMIKDMIHDKLAQEAEQGALDLESLDDEYKSCKKVMIAAIKSDSLALKHVSKVLLADIEFWRDAHPFMPSMERATTFMFGKDFLKGIMMDAVGQNGLILQFVPSSMQDDDELVLKAVSKNGAAFKYASNGIRRSVPNFLTKSESLKENIEFIQEALAEDLTNLDLFPGHSVDRKLALKAVRRNVKNYFRLRPEHIFMHVGNMRSQLDTELALCAIRKTDCEYKDVFEKIFLVAQMLGLRNEECFLQSVREPILVAVDQKSGVLQNLPEEFKRDKEIVLRAVQKNTGALLHCSQDLWKDMDILFASRKIFEENSALLMRIIQKNGLALKFASKQQMMNPQLNLVCHAVNENGMALEYAPDCFKTQDKIVEMAVRNDPHAFHFAHGAPRKNPLLIILSQRCNPGQSQRDDNSIDLASSSSQSKKDKTYMLRAVNLNGLNLAYASKTLKDDRDLVQAAVKKNGLALEYASAKLRNDKLTVQVAVQNDGRALYYASEQLKGCSTIVKLACQNCSEALQYATEKIKGEKFLILEIVQSRGLALRYASNLLRQDVDVVLAAVHENDRSQQYASDTILKNSGSLITDDFDFILQAVQVDGTRLQYASRRLKEDINVVKAAVTQNESVIDLVPSALFPKIFNFASADFRESWKIMLRAIEANEISMCYVTEQLKKNKKFNLEAVRRNGSALQYCISKFRNDIDVVVAAVVKNNLSLQFVPPELICSESCASALAKVLDLETLDDSTIERLLENNGLALRFCSNRIRGIKSIVKKAVCNNGLAIQYAPCWLRGEKDVVWEAINQNGTALQYASYFFQRDKEFVLKSVRNTNGVALQYAASLLLCDEPFLKTIFHEFPELRGCRDFWMGLQVPEVFRFASDFIRRDEEIVGQFVSRDGLALKFCSEDLKRHFDIVLMAISENGNAVQYASVELRNNEAIMLKAISRHPEAAAFASDDLKINRSFVLQCVTTNGLTLGHLGRAFQGDKDIALAAVHNNKDANQYVSNHFCDLDIAYLQPVITENESFMLDAVRECGLRLAYGRVSIRKNKQIVLAAVMQNPSSLAFADNSLQEDAAIMSIARPSSAKSFEFMYKAVGRDAMDLQYADMELRRNKELVLHAISRNGLSLQYASSDLKKDFHIVCCAIEENGNAVQYASVELRNNEAIMLKAISRHPEAAAFASDDLKINRSFVLQCVTTNGLTLGHLGRAFQGDKDIALAAVHNNKDANQYVSNHFCDLDIAYLQPVITENESFMLDAVRECGLRLAYGRVSIRKNKQIVLAAVMQNPSSLAFADNSLQEDAAIMSIARPSSAKSFEFMYKAVGRDAMDLQYADMELRENKKLVLHAVSRNGLSLQYASSDLKTDFDVVSSAVEHCGRSLEYADELMKKNNEIAIKAVCNDGLALLYISEILLDNMEIRRELIFASQQSKQCKRATPLQDEELLLGQVKQQGFLLGCLSEEQRENRRLVLAAVGQNGLALEYASQQLQEDQEVVKIAVSNKGLSLQFASRALQRNEGIILVAIKQDMRVVELLSSKMKRDKRFVLQILQANPGALKYFDEMGNVRSSLLFGKSTMNPLRNGQGPSSQASSITSFSEMVHQAMIWDQATAPGTSFSFCQDKYSTIPNTPPAKGDRIDLKDNIVKGTSRFDLLERDKQLPQTQVETKSKAGLEFTEGLRTKSKKDATAKADAVSVSAKQCVTNPLANIAASPTAAQRQISTGVIIEVMWSTGWIAGVVTRRDRSYFYAAFLLPDDAEMAELRFKLADVGAEWRWPVDAADTVTQ